MPIGRSYTNRFNRYKGRIVRQHGEGGVFKGYPRKYQQRGKGLGTVAAAGIRFVAPYAKQAALAALPVVYKAGKNYIMGKLGMKKKTGGGKKGGKKGKKKQGKAVANATQKKAYKAIASAIGAPPPRGPSVQKKKTVGGSRASKVANQLAQIHRSNERARKKKKKKQKGGTWTGRAQPNPFDVQHPPPFIGKWPT